MTHRDPASICNIIHLYKHRLMVHLRTRESSFCRLPHFRPATSCRLHPLTPRLVSVFPQISKESAQPAVTFSAMECRLSSTPPIIMDHVLRHIIGISFSNAFSIGSSYCFPRKLSLRVRVVPSPHLFPHAIRPHHLMPLGGLWLDRLPTCK